MNAFSHLGLSQLALSLVLDLWALIQVFDDIEDGHTPKKDEADRSLYAALVGLPMNDFYIQHKSAIAPALLVAVEKWKAANQAEKSGAHDAKSFMWRAGFYDVLALICLLDGKSAAPALSLYGETYQDYMKEFDHA